MHSTAFLALCSMAGMASAQFYADSNAYWCGYDAPLFGGPLVNMEMGSDPDTVILGQTYKRILEYHGPSPWHYSKRHYVRSAADGKGYVFLLDSMAEYLTGDINAIAGDTVHQVLVGSELDICSWVGLESRHLDVVVDSVVTLTNDGVTVSRHYVHETSCYYNGLSGYDPLRFFWQEGLGTFFGPALQIREMLGVGLNCAVVEETAVFGVGALYPGWPGGPLCCGPLNLGYEDASHSSIPKMSLYPNPTLGHLTVEFDDPLERDSFYSVYDELGRLLYQRQLPPGRENEEIDLLRFGKGAYVLRFTLPDSVRHERVVVE